MAFPSLWFFLVFSVLLVGALAQEYQITSVVANGSGCPPGTTQVTINEGGKGFSVSYDSLVTASAGPGLPISAGRKACQALLSLKIPEGYKFAIDQVTYRGSYSLQSGSRAAYNTKYYFQGTLVQGSGSGAISGAATSDGRILPQILSPTVWSPCGGDTVVNVIADVRASASRGASGSISLSSVQVPSDSFVWQKC